MRKLFITMVAIATVVTSASAESGQFRVGATVGLELSNMLAKDKDETYSKDFKSKAGLKIGVVAEYSFSDYFALAPELAFVQRGYKEKESETYDGIKYEATEKVNVNYLQIPINAVGRYAINDDFSVFGFAGPYFAFALSGKSSWEAKGGGESESGDEKLKIGSNKEEDDMKAFDFGLNFGVGAEYMGIFLKVQYNLGLGNLSLYTDNGYKINNRNFGISVGYMFSF